MKFKEFTPDNCPAHTKSQGKALVSVAKNGLISISRSAVEQMKLKNSDKVSILQDPANTQDWYLSVCPDEAPGFPLRKGGQGDGWRLVFSSNYLAQQMRVQFPEDSFYSKRGALAFLIAKEATEFEGDERKYWGLIIKTSTPKPK